jgi:hypothetical protein
MSRTLSSTKTWPRNDRMSGALSARNSRQAGLPARSAAISSYRIALR